MKCSYCHEKFNTTEGYNAHVQSCFYKDNPLPKPKVEKEKVKEDNKAEQTNAPKKTTTRRKTSTEK